MARHRTTAPGHRRDERRRARHALRRAPTAKPASAATGAAERAVDLDGRLVTLVDAEQVEILAGAHLTEFASRWFDAQQLDTAWAGFDPDGWGTLAPDLGAAVFPFWLLYDWRGVDGRSSAEACLDQCPPRSATLRAFMQAAAEAPWTVLVFQEQLTYDVSRFRDLLGGRTIQADGIWGHLRPGQGILAKPVQVPAFVSWAIVGGAGQPLEPTDVARVADDLGRRDQHPDLRELVRVVGGPERPLSAAV